MLIGGLFEGYGGLTAAIRTALGGKPAWFCENDPGASAVLAHNEPGVLNLGDITRVDWDTVPRVDVLAGGPPCQDLSLAGAGAGLRRDTRSGLWFHMADAIAALRPRLVVIENVRGLLSREADSDVEPCPWCLGDRADVPALRALGAVLGDLARLGYDARWCGLRASDVGAPHERFRVFVVAADTTRDGRHQGWPQPARLLGGPDAAVRGDGVAAHADRVGRQRPGSTWDGSSGPAHHGKDAADTDRTRRQGAEPARGRDLPARSAVRWGAYEPAVRRWEAILGRPAPAPSVPGRNGNAVLNPVFVEWLMGLDHGHVTAVPGLSRNQQLRILGNGVVPQQGAAALRRLLRHGAEAVPGAHSSSAFASADLGYVA
ncbi:DNA (cytosine-5-)-methyltransferase [Saccharothrix sp. NPDC042600]|uniref:DNA cytosine methyltransferase n=1 Tax=Saccharothrix TaxID=2071 RepID=UPI0033C9750E|nr:hypothetical protein GCM10017745_17890 [Saccharothrix mutabilis subsp. capreolus]